MKSTGRIDRPGPLVPINTTEMQMMDEDDLKTVAVESAARVGQLANPAILRAHEALHCARVMEEQVEALIKLGAHARPMGVQ